jgi:hypothetical protein
MTYEYTISSTDEDNYNRIYAYFEPIKSDTAILLVTSLTTNCNIRILKIGDYIVINNIKYEFNEYQTSLNNESFIDLLSVLTTESTVIFSLDTCNRIVIQSNNEFVINDASYNVRLLMGLHPFDNLEIIGVLNDEGKYYHKIKTVGFMLSTPVLYLTCNIGEKCYKNLQQNNQNTVQNMRVVMRINNSFSSNFPINSGNADFSTIVMSNDLSNVEFKLVDANMVEINLLSPMYISVSIKVGEIDEKLQILNKSTVGAMIYADEMKNNDRKFAELRNFDILSTMNAEDIDRIINEK